MKKPHSIAIECSLPLDIALRIASSLQVEDVCALGSCSQFWRELCRSDRIWEPLARNRWPSLSTDPSPIPTNMGWKEFYMETNADRAHKAGTAVEFVEQRSLQFADYKVLTEKLCSWQFSFKDVQMLLFKPTINVYLNLIALHYCIFNLQLKAKDIVDGLVSCKIADRRVDVIWWKLNGHFFGYLLKEKYYSLEDLVSVKHPDLSRIFMGDIGSKSLRLEVLE
ncbi:hypothetical protein Tsubulata_009603 [Turnera subulata]|uniref:F-box domain-containing protein n=1 Tax=Turnera subulata TaxID=218843 RepID=A0A9Q0F1X1_9ROSI|nr:hypothetical protein Tsubulata_009603 [Turnera subulata]